MALDPTVSLKVINPLDATAKAQANALNAQKLKNAPLERRKLEIDVQNAEREGRAKELEGALKEAETAFGLLSTATDANSYQVMRQRATALGVDISDIPEQYDPMFVKQATMLSLTAKDRIKAELDSQLNQARVATENAQAGSFDALAKQRLGAARNDAALTAEQIRKSRVVPAPAAAPTTSVAAPVAAPAPAAVAGKVATPVAAPVQPTAPAPVAAPQGFNFGPTRSLTEGIETPGQRATAVRVGATEAQKAIDAQNDVIAQENKTKAAMQEFAQAMAQQGGSPNTTYNIPVIGSLQRMLDPEVATMARVQAEVAPNMRPPGSGATSDYDAKQFERATVGPDKPTETNQRIIQARVMQAELAAERGQFLEAFRNQYGHVRGADAAWSRYLNNNPIFDRRKQDFSLNPNRKSWQEFFGGQAPQAAQPAKVDYKAKYGLE